MRIAIAEARRHWRDRDAPCNVVRRARDEANRYYWAHLFDADRGRRFRGRLLSRWNQAYGDWRRACEMCSASIDYGPVSLPLGIRSRQFREPNTYISPRDFVRAFWGL